MVHSVYTLDYLKLVRAGIADPPPVSGGKGDQLAKDNEKLQLDLNRQLFSTFQSQLGKQNQITGLLTKMLSPMIQNPTGFSPEALTALRTQATDTNSQQFHDAQTALNDQLAARGGSSTLPSGVDAQLRAGLAGLGAQTESQSQANISLANENQRQTNFLERDSITQRKCPGVEPTRLCRRSDFRRRSPGKFESGLQTVTVITVTRCPWLCCRGCQYRNRRSIEQEVRSMNIRKLFT